MDLKLAPLRRRFCGQQQIIKQYKVPFPTSMTLGSFETSKTVDVSMDVTWNPTKTELNQAVLVWRAHYFVGFYAQRAAEARLYVNDNLVSARGWQANEGCTTKGTEGTNIGAYLINGANKFRLELAGSWSPEHSGIDAIYVAFEAWFIGEEPHVKPTEPEWLTYLKWGALGVGILGAAYLGIRVYEARKKK